MLFNSFEFALFFAAVFLCYLVLPHRWQNRMLLAASYVFYGWWDWRFLSLIILSTVLDFVFALRIDAHETARARRTMVTLSVIVNLLFLGFFKYFNFFADNLAALAERAGIHLGPVTLNIVLPVGISFYTFQSMAYTIDVYRRHIRPTRNLLNFALYISFFPQLVAGPIERAERLLPQIEQPRKLSLQGFYTGSFLIGWGLFLKVFAADNLATLVDPVFAEPGPYQAATVLSAVLAFSMQIFADFAGYSYMAQGLAMCLGIELMFNFDSPYFAINPREFWRRWHISLSTWLRDYLYIPLGGNQGTAMRTRVNLFLTMLLGGLWHGAAWNFVVWGAYHGALLVAHRLVERPLSRFTPKGPGVSASLWYFARLPLFWIFVAYGWLLFRAQSMTQIAQMTRSLLNFPQYELSGSGDAWRSLALYASIPFAMQALQYWRKDPLVVLKLPAPVRAVFYLVCFYLLLIYGVSGREDFIYFQF